jgi:glyoxylase-like metal-dependent hydrolase (beta-lactamase superfamily II)
MDIYREGDIEVVRIGPLGPYGNNAYIVADSAAKASVIVDMPAEGEKLLEALGEGNVQAIVATHWHPDHWMSYDLVRGATKAPVYVHEAEVRIPPERIDARVADGQEIRVGSARIQVIHTPGHTPGSICLKLGRVLLTGDTLFPGGPGRTQTPEDLQTVVRSIAERLLRLEDDVLVWPGHGDTTTIGRARADYEQFAIRPHRPDLSGDVTWDTAE